MLTETASTATRGPGRLILLGVGVGLLVAIVQLLAGRATVGSAESNAACEDARPEAADYGAITGIARAETLTASQVADWQEGRHAGEVSGVTSPLRSEDANLGVTVCIYRGEFSTPVPPGLPPHNMLRLLILGSGRTLFDSAGYEGHMAPDVPSDWSDQAAGG